jgi:transcriptional regulator with XRE-family HTH domain
MAGRSLLQVTFGPNSMSRTRHSRRYLRFLAALRQARTDAGLTQVQVAEKLNNHASYVSKCESGERRIDVIELVDFCHLYGISVGSLLAKAAVVKTST